MEERKPRFGGDDHEDWADLLGRGVLRAALLGVTLAVGGYLLAIFGTVAAFFVADWWVDRKV